MSPGTPTLTRSMVDYLTRHGRQWPLTPHNKGLTGRFGLQRYAYSSAVCLRTLYERMSTGTRHENGCSHIGELFELLLQVAVNRLAGAAGRERSGRAASMSFLFCCVGNQSRGP